MNDRTAEIVGARAAIGDGQGGFVIDHIEVDPPQSGEVRVRLKAAGVCHTDHASLRWPGPLVLGHEGAGIVDAVGSGVSGLKPGQPVLLNWAIPCAQCAQCRRGRGSLCERTHGISDAPGTSDAHAGHTRWRDEPVARSFRLGCFAEYALVRAEALTPLPHALPMSCACILGCAVMTGVGAVVNVAQVRPGDAVVVVGCGGVGLSVVQGARLAEAGRIIAVDRHPAALDRARRFGASDCVQSLPDDPDGELLAAEIRRLTSGRGADHAFEATGSAALAFLPLKLVRNGGNAVQLSGAHGPATVDLPSFWWDKRYLVPLYGGCLPERDFPRLIDWALEGRLDLPGLISHSFRLGELGSALEHMLGGRVGKGVIVFDEAG